jgi:hypothetical protein
VEKVRRCPRGLRGCGVGHSVWHLPIDRRPLGLGAVRFLSSPVLASPRQSSTALPRKGTQTSDGRRIPAAAANQNKVRPPGIYSVQLLGIVTLR